MLGYPVSLGAGDSLQPERRESSDPIRVRDNCRYGAESLGLLRPILQSQATLLKADGKDITGPNPSGQLTYDADGHFSQIITRSDLPKFASDNRMAGTPEENKSIVQGSIAFFGTYPVSEADKIITRHIESCTFPNWNGTERKGSFSISGDEFNYTTLSKTSTGAGTAHDIWKRAK